MSYSTTLLSLIKRSISANDTDEDLSLTTADVFEIYTVAKRHDVAHLLAEALERAESVSVSDEMKAKLEKQRLLAIYRYERINFALGQICSLFESEGVDHLPLKGSVIRRYYPEPWMRTSCDIDILVREEQLEEAARLVEERLGFKRGDLGDHDISFVTQSGVHFELHYCLLEGNTVISEAEKPLAEVWDRVRLSAEKLHSYEMTPEDFYYYHIVHMAKHFVNGGCGIRPFIDLHILSQKLEVDREALDGMLCDGGLFTFEERALQLSRVWFGGGEHTEVTVRMQDYLLGGGVYGNVSNRVTVQQSKKGGKLKYALSRIWLPYDVLRFHYPSLNGKRWLLPIYEVRRWCKLIFVGGAARAVGELNANRRVSDEAHSSAVQMLDDLGI